MMSNPILDDLCFLISITLIFLMISVDEMRMILIVFLSFASLGLNLHDHNLESRWGAFAFGYWSCSLFYASYSCLRSERSRGKITTAPICLFVLGLFGLSITFFYEAKVWFKWLEWG